LGINNFAFYGTISNYSFWNGSEWVNNYLPSETYKTVIDDVYNTAIQGSFSCVELIINAGKTLTVDNNTYVEVENNVTVNGNLVLETKGAFVQKDNNSTFTNSQTGTSKVNKITPNKNAWYYYTYWSSPVSNMTIANAFPNVSASRRFFFNANNFLDVNGDGFDDNGNDWQIAIGSSIMTPGTGYAVTSSSSTTFPGTDSVWFDGVFNTGTITTPIAYTGDVNSLDHPNLIGNPYPSAIDFNQLHAQNSNVIEGLAYFWSQATPANSTGKFSQNDYATYSVGLNAGVSGASGSIPNQFVPTGQAFFVNSKDNGSVTFTNAMRMADATSNSQFFKNTNTKSKASTTIDNKLWVNLTSNNGVFSQILVGYVDGASNENDGLMYDAPKLESNEASLLYSTIENSTKRFVIQGKDINSLSSNEVIVLGFKTRITDATIYTISIAQLEGDFLSKNSIYLKDKLLNITHDLSSNDYAFSTEVGEFNNRFEIVFSAQALSTDALTMDQSDLKIIELNNDFIQFSVPSTLSIKKINVFDLLGKHVVDFKGNSSNEKHHFYNLNTALYIAEVTLNNGDIITKKFIKK
jgi:hypothetical protein